MKRCLPDGSAKRQPKQADSAKRPAKAPGRLAVPEMGGKRATRTASAGLAEKKAANLPSLQVLLPELEGFFSEFLPDHMPRPLVDTMVHYAAFTHWQLTTDRRYWFGLIDRTSDTSAQHVGHFSTDGYISGDTPLSSGKHAWRVALQGLAGARGRDMALGIVRAGKELTVASFWDPTFYGIGTADGGAAYEAGRQKGGCNGVGAMDSKTAVLDFVLDLYERSLTVIRVGQETHERCTFSNLPSGAWVPHFHVVAKGNGFSLQLIDPSKAGKIPGPVTPAKKASRWTIDGRVAGKNKRQKSPAQ